MIPGLARALKHWKWLLGSLVVLCAALFGVAYRAGLIQEVYVYSDRDSLKEVSGAARVRSVLWSPPREMPEPPSRPSKEEEGKKGSGAPPPSLPSSVKGSLLVSRKSPRGDLDIFLRELTLTGWSASRPIDGGAEGKVEDGQDGEPGINSPYDELTPALSPDASVLYFASNRPGGLGGFDLYSSRRTSTGWSKPVNLGPRVNSPFDDKGPAIHPRGSLLLYSTNRPKSFVLSPPAGWSEVILDNWHSIDMDIVYSLRVGEGEGSHWSAPRFVEELDSRAGEEDPCFSPTGDYVYFSSDRDGGLGGLDLYRCRSRLEGDPEKGSADLVLDPPENIGRPINSPLDDHAPRLFLEGFAMAYQVSDPRQRVDLLLETRTREVESEIEFASIPLRILVQNLTRLLALLVAGVLFLALTLILLRYRQFWKLSLVARSAVAAVIVHLGMLYGFYFWVVGDQIVALAQKEAPVEVQVERLLQAKITLDATRLEIKGPLPESPREEPELASAAGETRALERADKAHTPVPLAALLPERAVELETGTTLLVRPSEPPPRRAPSADAPVIPAPSPPEEGPIPWLPSPSKAPVSVKDLLEPAAGAAASLKADSMSPLESPPGMVAEPAGVAALADPVLARATTQVQDLSADARVLPPLARPAKEPFPAVTPLPVPAQAPVSSIERSLVGLETRLRPGRLSPQEEGTGPAPGVLTTEVVGSQAGSRSSPIGITPTARDTTNARELPQAPFQPFSSPRLLEGAPAVRLPQALPSAEVASNASASAWESVVPRPSGGRTGDSPLLHGPLRAELQSEAAAVESTPLTAPSDSLAAITAASPAALDSQLEPGLRRELSPRDVAVRLPEAGASSRASGASFRVADLLSPRELEGPLRRKAFELETAPQALAPPVLRIRPEEVGSQPSVDALGIAVPLPSGSANEASTAPSHLVHPAGEEERLTVAKASVRLPEAPPDLREETDLQRIRSRGTRKVLLRQMGGSKESEDSVSLALQWLSKHQSPDGRWDVDGFDASCQGCRSPGFQADCDAAITGLAILCFLGQNHTPATPDSPFRKNVARGIQWFLSIQKNDGNLAGDDERYTMYSHGMATLALSETYALTRDETLLGPLERAVELIISSQNKTTGGWRYRPQPPIRGDTSITGWQVLALTSARWAGVKVEEGVFDRARHWLDSEVGGGRHGGIYGYSTREEPRVAMVAEGLYARLLLGASRTDQNIEEAARYLHSETRTGGYLNNLYLLYYGNLALYNYQGWIWEKWNSEVRDFLIRTQEKAGPLAGSWGPSDPQSEAGGRVLSTCFATLALEVYYRYLPLYWRMEAPGKR